MGTEDKSPPFSKSIQLDEKLEFTNRNFMDIIRGKTSDDEGEIISFSEGELSNVPPYPSPYIFAVFATKAYDDWHTPETLQAEDAVLPDGWVLLTAASNLPKPTLGVYWTKNGYFGVAFWHPLRRQIVIAHRGTDFKNLGADHTDLNCITKNEYANVPQVQSAVTFTDIIKSAIRKYEEKEKTSTSFFITGHSLGGWLAQITTFSCRYLILTDNNYFNLDRDTGYSVNPRTVVFDSPGCLDVLVKMSKDFDVATSHSTVSVDSLDITTFLSAPNRVNTYNRHIGVMYRIYIDLTKTEVTNMNYNLVIHKMKRILTVFDENTGYVHKDMNGNLKMKEVVDWPISGFLHRGDAYKDFFTWAKKFNDYEPDLRKEQFQYHPIRYQTTFFDKQKVYGSRFTAEEFNFLKNYHALKMENYGLIKADDMLFDDSVFDLTEKTLVMEKLSAIFFKDEDKKSLYSTIAAEEIVPFVKNLLKCFPSVLRNMKKETISKVLYHVESRSCLKSVEFSHINVVADTLGISEFLKTSSEQVWFHEVDSGDNSGLLKLLRILSNNKSKFSFFSLDELSRRNLWDPGCILSEDNRLLILRLGHADSQQFSNNLITRLKGNISYKVIYVIPGNVRLPEYFAGQISVKHTVINNLQWSELTAETQQHLLKKEIISVHGTKFSLESFIGNEAYISNFLQTHPQYLRNLLNNREINLSGFERSSEDVKWAIIDVHEVITKKFLLDLLAQEGIMLVYSGLSSQFTCFNNDGLFDFLETKLKEHNGNVVNLDANDPNEFSEICLFNDATKIYWVQFLERQIILRQVYDPSLYMQRIIRFPESVKVDKTVLKLDHEIIGDDVFVFTNERGRRSFELQCQQNEGRPIGSWLQTESSEEEIHWLHKDNEMLYLRKSFNSLEPLEKYISVSDVKRLEMDLDERKLVDLVKGQSAIIVDEPGMGKTTTAKRIACFNSSNYWVLFITLNKCAQVIESTLITDQNIPAFLARASNMSSNVDLLISQELIELKLNKETTSKPLLVIFDGFDELSQRENKTRILSLLETIRSKATVIVTSRTNDLTSLKNSLAVFPIFFKHVHVDIQKKYLKFFWGNWVGVSIEETEFESNFNAYCRQLYEKATSLFDNKFIGVPLQVRLMAEGFLKHFCEYSTSTAKNEDLFNELSITTVYQHFIAAKFRIFINDKVGLDSASSRADRIKKFIVRPYMKIHQRLAFWFLLGIDVVEMVKKDPKTTLDDQERDDVCLVGLIPSISDGHIEFLHRTVAEYFAAEFLHQRMKNKEHHSGHPWFRTKLISHFLLRGEFSVVRIFLENLLTAEPIEHSYFKMDNCKALNYSEHFVRVYFDDRGRSALNICLMEHHPHLQKVVLDFIETEFVMAEYFFTRLDNEKTAVLFYLTGIRSPSNLERCLDRIDKYPRKVARNILLATSYFIVGQSGDTGHQYYRQAANFLAFCKIRPNLKDIVKEIDDFFDDVRVLMSTSITECLGESIVKGNTRRDESYVKTENKRCEHCGHWYEYVFDFLIERLTTQSVKIATRKMETKPSPFMMKYLYSNIAPIKESYLAQIYNFCSGKWFPLHEAAKRGFLDVVKEFTMKYDRDGKSSSGNTALQHAVARNRVAIVKFFLENGCRASHDVKKLLILAKKHKSSDVITYLKQVEGEEPKYDATRGEKCKSDDVIKGLSKTEEKMPKNDATRGEKCKSDDVITYLNHITEEIPKDDATREENCKIDDVITDLSWLYDETRA